MRGKSQWEFTVGVVRVCGNLQQEYCMCVGIHSRKNAYVREFTIGVVHVCVGTHNRSSACVWELTIGALHVCGNSQWD